jgi:hypothetical protein
MHGQKNIKSRNQSKVIGLAGDLDINAVVDVYLCSDKLLRSAHANYSPL